MQNRKANVIIRMGAPAWTVSVFVPTAGEYVTFDMRRMTGKEKSNFHREFMNAFRESIK